MALDFDFISKHRERLAHTGFLQKRAIDCQLRDLFKGFNLIFVVYKLVYWQSQHVWVICAFAPVVVEDEIFMRCVTAYVSLQVDASLELLRRQKLRTIV
jgi:hypothetical protein